MTELQAGKLDISGTQATPRPNRAALIALAVFVVLALLPMLTSSKFLLDFVIRCSAYGLFATSLNLLVGYTAFILCPI